MADAVLHVTFAGPLVSVQDRGRFGHLRFGVSASGPMDRLGAAVANAALGQCADATVIEVSLGGLALEVAQGAVTLAVAGGGFAVEAAGAVMAPWTVVTLQAGERLTLRAGAWGSWCYVGFAGALQSTRWLGHAATHAMTGFGGGAVTTGQVLRISDAGVRPARVGDLAIPASAQPSKTVPVVVGPQEQYFSEAALRDLLTEPFTFTPAFDRMGARLSGPKLSPDGALSIPSEPILRGSVQVSGDGVPTVLLADHGTTGGYPKIATVVAADLDRFVQNRAGDTVRFVALSPEDAIARARQNATEREACLALARQPRGTLADRLMRENLVSGVIFDDGRPEP